MEMSHTAAEKSGLSFVHTSLGLLWIGMIYLVSWKPELLDHMLAGSKAFAAAIVRFLESAPIL